MFGRLRSTESSCRMPDEPAGRKPALRPVHGPHLFATPRLRKITDRLTPYITADFFLDRFVRLRYKMSNDGTQIFIVGHDDRRPQIGARSPGFSRFCARAAKRGTPNSPATANDSPSLAGDCGSAQRRGRGFALPAWPRGGQGPGIAIARVPSSGPQTGNDRLSGAQGLHLHAHPGPIRPVGRSGSGPDRLSPLPMPIKASVRWQLLRLHSAPGIAPERPLAGGTVGESDCRHAGGPGAGGAGTGAALPPHDEAAAPEAGRRMVAATIHAQMSAPRGRGPRPHPEADIIRESRVVCRGRASVRANQAKRSTPITKPSHGSPTRPPPPRDEAPSPPPQFLPSPPSPSPPPSPPPQPTYT